MRTWLGSWTEAQGSKIWPGSCNKISLLRLLLLGYLLKCRYCCHDCILVTVLMLWRISHACLLPSLSRIQCPKQKDIIDLRPIHVMKDEERNTFFGSLELLYRLQWCLLLNSLKMINVPYKFLLLYILYLQTLFPFITKSFFKNGFIIHELFKKSKCKNTLFYTSTFNICFILAWTSTVIF